MLQVLPLGAQADQVAAGTLTTSSGAPVTFARSTTKFCRTGPATLTAIALNLPCVESAGVRIEASHTNLNTASQSHFDNSWTKVGSPTVTDNAVAAPDGTITASKIQANQDTTGASTTQIYRGFSATDGSVYTLTFWAKAGTTSNLDIIVNTGTTIPQTSIVLTAAWAPYSYTFTAHAANVYPELGWASTYSVNGKYVYVWGAQVELGSYGKSYSATAGSTGLSTLDFAELVSSRLPVAAGVLELDVVPMWSAAPGDVWLVNTRNASTGKSGFQIYSNAVGQVLATSYDSASSTQIASASLAWTPGQSYRIRYVWGAGKMSLSRDGTVVASDTSGTAAMPDAVNPLSIGIFADGSSGPCDCWISNLRVER